MDDRAPGAPHDDLSAPGPCACNVCICDRIRELEQQIKAMQGVSAATYSVAVKPLEARLAELKALREKIDWKRRVQTR